MLGTEKIPNERAAVTAKVLQSTCEIWLSRLTEEAPPPRSHGIGLSHDQSHQQRFQHSGNQTTGSIFGGLLRVLKGFESEGMTLTFDALGKGIPNRRTIVH